MEIDSISTKAFMLEYYICTLEYKDHIYQNSKCTAVLYFWPQKAR